MLKRILPILLAATVLLTACGPQAAPTMSAADVQGTAVSAAWTMVAATQQAIPTATAIPPTETPSPTPLATFTQPPLPTSNLPTIAVTPTSAVSGDPCNAPISGSAAGPTVLVRIVNKNKAQFNGSMGLSQVTPFGECGIYGISLSPSGSQNMNVLVGCYWLAGWVNDPKHPSTVSGRGFCVNGEDKITIELSADSYKVIYP